MHPACSHVTSQGSLRCYVCQTNHIKALCIPHGEGRTEFLRKKYEKLPYKYKKRRYKKKYLPTLGQNAPIVSSELHVCYFSPQVQKVMIR